MVTPIFQMEDYISSEEEEDKDYEWIVHNEHEWSWQDKESRQQNEYEENRQNENEESRQNENERNQQTEYEIESNNKETNMQSNTNIKRSWTWAHFTNDKATKKAKCNHCKILISSNQESTSGMASHLKSKHRILKNQQTIQGARQLTLQESV